MVADMTNLIKNDKSGLISGKRIKSEYTAPSAEAAISLGLFTAKDKTSKQPTAKVVNKKIDTYQNIYVNSLFQGQPSPPLYN